ncbi:MAG: membrane protein insertion efficiency factor YidD [Planctomycetia bacterium]|nr:membrane protein insertion efficiency factor YidD [Planctomycetia bacterium]
MDNSCSQPQAGEAQGVPPSTAVRLLRLLWNLPALALIGMVRLYQILLSPIFGRQCRFQPTCSNYFIQAVRKYGAVSGSLRGAWRICRCHPFHPGGYDPP